ncbi:tetratricopeptide repeat protein [Paenibacillus sp. LMG 31459]|uniref:Tetratricopeptide repeat protein n=1 Tax=Paenibacillus phytohabitans TaxID=2654978 RepID=A0ABX1YE35_9BACL|nr:CDP-glycerol glycerophosphotransferase family protein [Paenibacillus phytohabitans]NOU79240.1 tetratricopeptide repeat protein [Paenibacillus phytohabitans]
MTTNKIKITLFHTSSSGSNNHHLYRAAPDALRDKYDIELLTSQQALYNRNLNNSDVYITTHGEHATRDDKVNVELWHGFPLKGMAKMDKQETATDEKISNYWSNVDMIMSYSSLYNTAMNACSGARIQQYQITGVPRNDALLTANGRAHLMRVIPEYKDTGENIIFFMPTFRKSIINPDKIEGGKNFSNLFGLPEFNKDQLVQFLRSNNSILIIKLHPFEERFFSKELQELTAEKVYTLNDERLETAGLDLYDVLNAADMLLTDYSSVYIDYLLLDRPMMFLPTDLEDYRENRGFLLEPYEFWTPGPKISSQEDLQETIIRLLNEPEWYKSERSTILNLCHKYKDPHSSERIWKLIDSFIQDNTELIYHRREQSLQHRKMQQEVKSMIQGIIDQGQLVLANEAIQNYLESNSADSDIFSMNGMLHLLNNDPQEAIHTFQAGYKHFPWDEDLLYNIGYVFELLGDKIEAIRHYEEALRLSSRVEMTELLRDKLKSIT